MPLRRCTGPSGCRRAPPAGRRRDRRLELAANDAWPAPIRRPGWAAGSCAPPSNWTGRANSALAVGDPDRTARAPPIDAVEQWYAAHGQQPLINAPMPLAAPVNAALDERGWTARPLTLVQTAPLAAVRTPWTGPAGDARARRSYARRRPADDWFAMVADHKGTPAAGARRGTSSPAYPESSSPTSATPTAHCSPSGAARSPARTAGSGSPRWCSTAVGAAGGWPGR